MAILQQSVAQRLVLCWNGFEWLRIKSSTGI